MIHSRSIRRRHLWKHSSIRSFERKTLRRSSTEKQNRDVCKSDRIFGWFSALKWRHTEITFSSFSVNVIQSSWKFLTIIKCIHESEQQLIRQTKEKKTFSPFQSVVVFMLQKSVNLAEAFVVSVNSPEKHIRDSKWVKITVASSIIHILYVAEAEKILFFSFGLSVFSIQNYKLSDVVREWAYAWSRWCMGTKVTLCVTHNTKTSCKNLNRRLLYLYTSCRRVYDVKEGNVERALTPQKLCRGTIEIKRSISAFGDV